MKLSHVVVVLMSVFAASLVSPSMAHSAAAPAVALMLTGGAVETQLETQVVGTGIEGIVPVRRGVVPAGELVWLKIRDRVDHLGMQHVFYQQHLLTAGLPEPVRLVGAEIGLHYEPTGELRSVYGTQYETVEIAADLLVGAANSAEALATVSESAAALGLLPARDVFSSDPGIPQLLLAPSEKGFRFVWEVPMRARAVGRRIAIVDGASGEVLKVEDRTPWSECASQSSTRVYAKAEPQNQSLSDRWIWASPSNDRGVSYTHEGHRSATTGIPDIEVFQGDYSGCDPDDAWYTVVPLKTISSTVWYDDWTSPDTILGRAAGDAMHTTYQTMTTLNNLGWQSYDGYGSDAKIVVDADCDGNDDNAAFREYGAEWVPANGVAVCPKDELPYLYSAALDVVAHEWGHGVVYSSADWTYSGDGMSYHEGFADVVGYLTEWDQQPSGSGAEKAEWTYAEDNGGAARRVDVDDGTGGLSFHANDTPGGTPGTVSYYYNSANRLPVAYRLLAVGGTNPACSRLPGLSGCGTSITGQGISDASEVYFRVLTSYATSSSDWDDFANLAKLAAFDLFAECSAPCYHATSEQQAAMQSFTAVGYPPGSSATLQCKPMQCL